MSYLWDIVLRTCLLYFLILVVFRIMGKREIGELSLLDLVVFIMIADIAVIGIENFHYNILRILSPILTLLAIQVALARLSLKFPRFRKRLDGSPTVIIHGGKIDERAMRRQRYNFDDLLMQLREQGIRDVANVDYAILETSGHLSVFEKNADGSAEKPATLLPLIQDGIIHIHNLKELNRSQDWLISELKKLGFGNYKKISYCSYHDGRLHVDLIDESI